MTFNGATFPSSPLSRSAFQGDADTRMIAGGVARQRMSLKTSPEIETKGAAASNWSRSPMSLNRGSSNPNPLLLSPIQGSSNTSPRSSLYSTSPLYPPPNRSPDSINSRSLATSSISNMRLSPVFRSSPSSAARRRFSEQSFASGGLFHHSSPGPNFGSFVGSYEESLLSGRMSTLPSKPLMFDAELGVLGLGKCKASLKCPPHVTFKFPAHFYSLDKTSDKEGSLSPGTPYVGTIDVEGYYIDKLIGSNFGGLSSDLHVHPDRPMSLLDGPTFPGYRIPPKGQIQLIVKNPNMTAVKLFLVPYDFTDMPAGTKTFIRQKSHVASPGPGVETNIVMPSTPSPQSNRRTSDQSAANAGRETLRYAIHLHFCALPSSKSSKGRQSEPGFNAGGLDRLNHRRKSEETDSKSKKQSTSIYLHRQIRVVFDARMPDRSEKLRVVTDTPAGSEENRQNNYSTYFGPSEDWKQAKRIRRADLSAERDAQSSLLEEGAVGIERTAEKMQGEDLGEAAFHDGIINSDPNGENWFAESTTPVYDDAMDIPLTSRSPWREPEQEIIHTMEDNTSVSEPTKVTSFPSAAFNEGSSSNSRASSTTVSAAIQRATSPDSERADDDRVLLEQWYASLHLRTNQIRPSSPITPNSRNSKPTSPRFAKSPISPTNGFFSLMNRSTSSIGSNGSNNGSSAGQIQRQASSATRIGPRTTSSNRSVVGHAAPHGPRLPRPVQATLDLDPASGVMEQLPSSSPAKRPSLIRQWSSQIQLSASSSGRVSPVTPTSPA